MKIKRGAMRAQITVQQLSATPGTLGQSQWETFAVRRAEKKPTTGRELNAPEIGGSDVDTEFVLAYLPGVKANMQVIIAGDTSKYPIKYVVTETPGQPMLTHLFCREVMSA
jgi:head-tail adaptor